MDTPPARSDSAPPTKRGFTKWRSASSSRVRQATSGHTDALWYNDCMSNGVVSGVDLVFDSAAETMTPEVARWLGEFHASPELHARLEDFAERNGEGKLSEAEREEYSALVELGDIFSILRLRARKYLSEQNALGRGNAYFGTASC